MKKYAVLHEPGDIVTLAGTRFVVLDVERRGSLPDSLFLLALESVGASEFGNSNNYAEIDLTTLDGFGCYGKLSVMAAPLTLDEAREYADIIPNAERWYWLATGWSNPGKSDSNLALCVNYNGVWSYNYCSNSDGIRPALKVQTDIIDSSADKLDMSEVPTDVLLEEIHKRIVNRQ